MNCDYMSNLSWECRKDIGLVGQPSNGRIVALNVGRDPYAAPHDLLEVRYRKKGIKVVRFSAMYVTRLINFSSGISIEIIGVCLPYISSDFIASTKKCPKD